MSPDVVVVGAGIVGSACAWALARARLRVTVIEPEIPGGGATAAGMGHVLVLDDSEAQLALTRYSRDLWNELAGELPREAEYERRGTLWVAADEEEMAAVRDKHSWYGARGVGASILDSAALEHAEPQLRKGLAGALLVPGDGVVYAPCASRWLLDQSGASVRRGVSVVALEGGAARLSDDSTLTAGAFVVATGADATRLIPGLPMRPRKGHLAITDRYPGFVHHPLVELGYLKSAHGAENESVAANIQPRATGQLLIGSSRQFDTVDPRVEPALLQRMLRRAVEYLPGLAVLKVIRTWTGFRAATADHLPLIGPCPGRPDIWLATGHEGLGITTSLGTARLVADGLTGRTPPIDAAPYLPARSMAHG